MQIGTVVSGTLTPYRPAAREVLPCEPQALPCPTDVGVSPLAIEPSRVPHRDPAQALVTGAFVSLAVAASFVPAVAAPHVAPEKSISLVREKREDDVDADQPVVPVAVPGGEVVAAEQPPAVPVTLLMEQPALPGPASTAVSAPPQPAVPAKPVAALTLPGTSKILDDNLTWRTSEAVPWRTFGHRTVSGRWFDGSGNWTDTGTAVTADQVAAMSAAQRQGLARGAGIPVEALRTGDAERVLLDVAVGSLASGEIVDTNQALRSTAPVLSFGHEPVDGHLFRGRLWADTGTIVSADQVAAMGKSQRSSLALAAGVPEASLRIGQAERALRTEDAGQGNTAFDAIARHSPNQVVTTHGFRMTAKAAAHYERLLGLVHEQWPGRDVHITSTVGGRHTDPRHRQGRAIDFVVEPLTNTESVTLEKLAWRAGFQPYNEYVHDSPCKTGPHMHVSLD